MVCPKCGATLPDDTLFCAQCGASMQAQPEQTNGVQQPYIPPQYAYNTPPQQSGKPPINGTTYLIFAILSTVMCCPPFGIPAIIFATKIDKLQAMGDFEGAANAAKKSKMWSIIAAATVAVLFVLYIIFIVLIGVGVAGNAMYY